MSVLTIEECITRGAHVFREAELHFGHGTDNAEDEAFWLVCHALSIGFDSDESVLSQEVTPQQWSVISALFQQRIQTRQPTAYLTGEAWFCGYPFFVNRDVLVPRSPLAELIMQSFQPWLPSEPEAVLDLGTGSGCIGIATALYHPQLRVDLADISVSALEVAQSNISRYGLQGRVETICSDVFSGLSNKRYDLILSNPPYVDARDLAAMPQEYHAEPALGLGSGEDGLDITRKILQQSAEHLNDDGHLVVEVGNSWENLETAFPRVPFLWLEFVSGGHGVFLMSKQQLIQYQAEFH